MSAQHKPQPHRFTVHDFHRMAQVGILGEDRFTELLDGLIIDVAPTGPEHSYLESTLHALLIRRLPSAHSQVYGGAALWLSETHERYPDLMVLPRGFRQIPRGSDPLLVIEIADSTLAYDLEPKRAAYEAAGVLQYWVVDVAGKRVADFVRGPTGNCYLRPSWFGRGDSITLQAVPGVSLEVSELFA